MKITRCDHCGKDRMPVPKHERGNLVYRYPMIAVKLDPHEDEADFCNTTCLHGYLEKKMRPLVQPAPQG